MIYMYATMGDQWLVKKLLKIEFHHKNEVARFFTDVTDFDNEQKCISAS